MNFYSEDLRKKIVRALEKGMPKKVETRGHSHLRCGGLLPQALRGHLPWGEVAGPQQASRLQTETG